LKLASIIIANYLLPEEDNEYKILAQDENFKFGKKKREGN
jgi:hypothetical protein